MDKLMSHSTTPIRARGADEASMRFARYQANRVTQQLRELASAVIVAAVSPAATPDADSAALRELAGRIDAAAASCQRLFPDVAAMASVAVDMVDAAAKIRCEALSVRARQVILAEASRLLYQAVVELRQSTQPTQPAQPAQPAQAVQRDPGTANLLQALADLLLAECAGPDADRQA